MTGLRYSPLHVTEFCGEMQGKFKVGLARTKKLLFEKKSIICFKSKQYTQDRNAEHAAK